MLEMDEDLKVQFAQKVGNGTQAECEAWWTSEKAAEHDKTLISELKAAIQDAVEKNNNPENKEISANMLFPPDDQPNCYMLLPLGYYLSPDGVFRTSKEKDTAQNTQSTQQELTRLTSTPFFVAARDIGNAQVKLVVRLQHDWKSEWLKASRLNVNKLTDWFIYPEFGVKNKELIDYAHACVRVAPFAIADDYIAMTAVHILMRLFPADINNTCYAEFPAFRAFADIRTLAVEYDVDPMAIRRYYKRNGFIVDKYSKTTRQGADTPRITTFTSKVKDFLQTLV